MTDCAPIVARPGRGAAAMSAGISVAYRADGGIRSHYFPIRHPDTDNFDPEQVFRWLKDLIASDVRFVTQNGLYDWGWLRADGGIRMPPADRLEEIGALATLVDENRFSYSLDALCAWRGLPGKDETLLSEAVNAAGFAPKRKNDQRRRRTSGNCRHATSAPMPRPTRRARWRCGKTSIRSSIAKERATPIGSKSICCRWCIEMRRRGIRIDQAAAEQARDLLLQKRDAVLAELSEKLGSHVSMDEIGSTEMDGATPSTRTASIIRARRKAIPRSRPARPDGCASIRTGCRS